MPYLEVYLSHEVTMRDQSKQTGKSEDSTHSHDTISVWTARYKKVNQTQGHKNHVNIVPSIHKEDLRTIGNDSHYKLHKKYPYKDTIEYFHKRRIRKHEEDSINKRKNDDNRDDQLEYPVLDYWF